MARPNHLDLRDLSWRRVALVVAAAFAVKLVVLMQLWNHPLLQPHGELDTAYYITLSKRIASEGVLASIGAFFVSPLYVYFLAAVFAAGGSLLAAQLIQIALGAVAVGLLLATAQHWFGERAAVVAAGLAILTGIFAFNEVLILQSALDPFLVSCALYALTRTMAGGGAGAVAAAGASLGLLALNRPNALVFAVAAAAVVFVSKWRDGQIKSGAVLVFALLAVLIANAARNYAVSGDVVLIASHGGLNLYIGNHDRADGTYTPVPGITPSIAGQAGDSTRVAESSAGRSLSPGEVSSYFAWRAIDWVTGHPADAARLWIRKIRILLNHVDVPLNYSYAFYAREPFSFLRVLTVGPWLLLPFGLVGLFWPALRKTRQGYWVWAMFVPVYGAAVVLFFVTDRYRMPLFVPLCAAAGAALVRCFDLVRARRLDMLLRPAGGLAMISLVVFSNLGLDNGVGGEQTRNAVWLVEQGSFDEARRYVEQVSHDHRHPGVLRFQVAQALLDAGRPDDAATLLVEASAIDGPRPAIRLALGEALLRAGRAGEAVKQLSGIEDSVAGTSVEAALDLGTAALEQHALPEAIRWLQIAVQHAPDRAEAQEKLGLAIFLNGDPPAARPYLERACTLDPGSASAHLNLAAIYAELGRFAEARSQAVEALRLDPTETRAVGLLKALPK
jgi:Flp pilus assembly protein TadD/4-amino-4-deoxy-L-arabinose transferase-like glycosyltransferase